MSIHDPYNTPKEELECPECKALRTGLTWIGEPPKCPKHQPKVKMNYYW